MLYSVKLEVKELFMVKKGFTGVILEMERSVQIYKMALFPQVKTTF